MTDAENMNPFGDLAVDPAAFMKTLEGVRGKAKELYQQGSFPSFGLDLSAFTNALELLVQQIQEAYAGGSSGLPLDVTSLNQQIQERLGKFSSSVSPLDATAFSKTLQQIMTMNTDMVNAMGQNVRVTDLFNPGFWFKISQETLRQTSEIMTGAIRPAAPAAKEEQTPIAESS